LQLFCNTNFRFIFKLPVIFKSVSFWITECNKLTVVWKHSQIRGGVEADQQPACTAFFIELRLHPKMELQFLSASPFSAQYSKLLQLRGCVPPLHVSAEWRPDYSTLDSSTYWEQLTFPIRDSQSINHCPPTQKWLSSKCGLQIRESNLSAYNQAAKVLFPYPGRLMKAFRVSKNLYSLVRMKGVSSVHIFQRAFRSVEFRLLRWNALQNCKRSERWHFDMYMS
jgi:hypothetical protein